ncbi:MAG: hypothetical protein HWN68_02225 [Desulfobacterales bacterium]|nr:hypothetical protein [Desulfobacterales bacterium]
MRKERLYLAHPSQLMEYGFKLEKKLEEAGFVVDNPFAEEWKRMKATEEISMEKAEQAVYEDVNIGIGTADFVIAITHGEAASIGTHMEIRAAYAEYRKPVYILTSEDMRYHIFLMTHGQVFIEESALLEAIKARRKVAEFSRGTGVKYDQGKPMVDLLVPEFVEDIAKVLTMGAEKYGIETWKKGLEAPRILAALYRHVLAYHKGENIDPESGLSHLCHISCNAMFLYWYDEVAKD